MGLLYPDHPDDSRPGLFDRRERPSNRRAPRHSDKQYSRRKEEHSARVYNEPPSTSTTSSELKSLNDLMVRPPATRRESEKARMEREDFRDARRQERRERRERRERMARSWTPSPEPVRSSPRRRERRNSEATLSRTPKTERSPSPIGREVRDEEDNRRRVRGPRKAERPRSERTSTYESERRRESTSPRKRRPSYADSRRHSSYNDKAFGNPEPGPQRRRDSRSLAHTAFYSPPDVVKDMPNHWRRPRRFFWVCLGLRDTVFTCLCLVAFGKKDLRSVWADCQDDEKFKDFRERIVSRMSNICIMVRTIRVMIPVNTP